MQHGGGNCSLCGSPGTNKTSCPLNPQALNPNSSKHPFANSNAPIARRAPSPIAQRAPSPIAPSPIAPSPIARRASRSQEDVDKTIKNIISNIEIIQGPIGAQYMSRIDKSMPYPELILLSDLHFGDGKCERCYMEEGCYSLYKDMSFLNYLDRAFHRENIPADIYIEYWDYIGKLDFKGHNSSLTDVADMLKTCRLKSSPICPLKHIRTHITDIRKTHKGIDKNFKYMGDMIYILYSKFNSDELFEKLCSKAFPGFPFGQILDLVQFFPHRSSRTLEEVFWSHEFFKAYSRIHHELSKVPEHIRKDIMKLSQPTLKGSKFPIHESSMVDMYTLARIFKSTESKVSIVYLGAMHIYNISNFLINAGYYSIIETYGEQGHPYELVAKFEKDRNFNKYTSFNSIKCIKKSRKL